LVIKESAFDATAYTAFPFFYYTGKAFFADLDSFAPLSLRFFRPSPFRVALIFPVGFMNFLSD